MRVYIYIINYRYRAYLDIVRSRGVYYAPPSYGRCLWTVLYEYVLPSQPSSKSICYLSRSMVTPVRNTCNWYSAGNHIIHYSYLPSNSYCSYALLQYGTGTSYKPQPCTSKYILVYTIIIQSELRWSDVAPFVESMGTLAITTSASPPLHEGTECQGTVVRYS